MIVRYMTTVRKLKDITRDGSRIKLVYEMIECPRSYRRWSSRVERWRWLPAVFPNELSIKRQ